MFFFWNASQRAGILPNSRGVPNDVYEVSTKDSIRSTGSRIDPRKLTQIMIVSRNLLEPNRTRRKLTIVKPNNTLQAM
jgi:hypothetical protein